jgi:hypothetical protein
MVNLNVVRQLARPFMGEGLEAAGRAAARGADDAASTAGLADDIFESAASVAGRGADATGPFAALAPRSGVMSDLQAARAAAQTQYDEAFRAAGNRIDLIPEHIKLNLETAKAAVNLAEAQAALARLPATAGDAAVTTARRSVADAHRRLGDVLARGGNLDDAAAHYRLTGEFYEGVVTRHQAAGEGMRVAPNNQALHSFAAAGDTEAVLRAVGRHGGQYTGGTAAILRQASAFGELTPQLRASAQAVYDRAVQLAADAGRPHPFGNRSIDQLFDGLRAGRLNGITLEPR